MGIKQRPAGLLKQLLFPQDTTTPRLSARARLVYRAFALVLSIVVLTCAVFTRQRLFKADLSREDVAWELQEAGVYIPIERFSASSPSDVDDFTRPLVDFSPDGWTDVHGSLNSAGADETLERLRRMQTVVSQDDAQHTAVIDAAKIQSRLKLRDLVFFQRWSQMLGIVYFAVAIAVSTVDLKRGTTMWNVSSEGAWRPKLATLSLAAILADALMVAFFWTAAPLESRFSAESLAFQIFDALSHGGTALLMATEALSSRYVYNVYHFMGFCACFVAYLIAHAIFIFSTYVPVYSVVDPHNMTGSFLVALGLSVLVMIAFCAQAAARVAVLYYYESYSTKDSTNGNSAKSKGWPAKGSNLPPSAFEMEERESEMVYVQPQGRTVLCNRRNIEESRVISVLPPAMPSKLNPRSVGSNVLTLDVDGNTFMTPASTTRSLGQRFDFGHLDSFDEDMASRCQSVTLSRPKARAEKNAADANAQFEVMQLEVSTPEPLTKEQSTPSDERLALKSASPEAVTKPAVAEVSITGVDTKELREMQEERAADIDAEEFLGADAEQFLGADVDEALEIREAPAEGLLHLEDSATDREVFEFEEVPLRFTGNGNLNVERVDAMTHLSLRPVQGKPRHRRALSAAEEARALYMRQLKGRQRVRSSVDFDNRKETPELLKGGRGRDRLRNLEGGYLRPSMRRGPARVITEVAKQ